MKNTKNKVINVRISTDHEAKIKWLIAENLIKNVNELLEKTVDQLFENQVKKKGYNLLIISKELQKFSEDKISIEPEKIIKLYLKKKGAK